MESSVTETVVSQTRARPRLEKSNRGIVGWLLDINGGVTSSDEETVPFYRQIDRSADPDQPIELENRDRAVALTASLGEGRGELRPALDRVRALAGLDLDELGDDLIHFDGGEPGDRGALGSSL
jgi:hypothetical protein